LNPKTAGGPDPLWPTTGKYAHARVGVPVFDIFTKSALSYFDYADVMTYCDKKWVSDYTFQKWWLHDENRADCPVDISAPTVKFLTPANESSISGTFNVTLDIQDDNGIQSVTYRINGQPQGLLSAPYSFNVNPATVQMSSSQVIVIEVTATDVAGRSTTNSIAVQSVP
jgi:hypothetical protein